MKRTLFVVVAVLVALATGASAATLQLVSDKTTYFVGETITLTTSDSDAGASAYGILGRLEYNEALVDAGTQAQTNMGGWSKGTLLVGSGYSEAFSQIAGLTGKSATNLSDVSNTPFSTVTLIAQALGTVNVTWNEAAGSGFELQFFGLSSAPGTSFTIVPVPEPTTMALLGLGLVGLVMGGRRRS